VEFFEGWKPLSPLQLDVEEVIHNIHRRPESAIPTFMDDFPSWKSQDDTSANVVCDTPSPMDAETGADTERSTSKGDTEILIVDEERDEDQAGSNQGQSHVALAGPNPEPMHKDFIAKPELSIEVHENESNQERNKGFTWEKLGFIQFFNQEFRSQADEPVYPEYIPPEDDVFPAEEQPLPAATSPTADSPGYIPESDPERDPEEDDEEDPEEDPADYPADRRDDDDDDDDDDEEEDEEEEEHLAPADYTVVALPAVDHVPSEEETEPFETDECAATPPSPPSPLIPYSSPLPQIPSPPLPIPSPPPNSPTHIEVPESCLPLRKRLRFAAPTPNHEVGESSAAGAARQDGPAVAREDPYSVARGDLYGFVDRVDVAPGRPMSRELDYGITDTWDDLVGAIEEIAPTTLEGVNQRVTNLSTIVEQETAIMYVGQCALISELQSADHRRQGVIKELLAADHQRQVQLTKALKLLKGLQTQMAELQRRHRPAKGPAQPNAPGEAGSSS
ncbi:hypothetical protein Tco_0890117, partial [Tanacetum coccineum]